MATGMVRRHRALRATPERVCRAFLDQEGIPEVIPIQACHLGWQESQALLALLVEAEIPGRAVGPLLRAQPGRGRSG